jgi:heat shock protein HslJ/membrane-bound inhibitor of C-type lysozyme
MRLASIVIGMIVLLGGCARARVSPPGQDVTLVGTSWTVERIEELVADRASTTVRFEEGRVSGRAGCNQYSGYLQAAGNALRVSETRSTRMACPPPVMQQETRFLAALGAVRTARRDGDRVLLLDETGHVRLRLVPVPTATGPPRRAHVYDCVDGPGLAISEADGEAVDAWLPDGRRRLTRVPTASGARYVDDQVSVWNKGTEVLLERDGRSWHCAENQPRDPR